MKKHLVAFILLFLIAVMLSPAVFADQIELQNGQQLRGDVQNSSLTLQTSYAELNLQSQYINKIDRANGNFVIRASASNRFSGQLLSDITFLANGGEQTFAASEISSVDFSNSNAFNDNTQISVSLRNGDFFSASTVDNSISVNTSLGSLNISYNNLTTIEYLSGEDIFLIRRNNASDIEANLGGQQIIVWPAAAEIVELEFDYVSEIAFN
ncbi:hypothetical protein C8C77_11339 [Halanaerobium saccharolyticum]|uniref:Uncharacterized protein n=1 Tax=Halanaerobium saccharolyticum TaxID=43595 RepID=A0A4R7Z296_9FIRM|nr:hypothetical protein [Halanaerobium saccharolyticum]RAK07493.1 hypothetical protein C7958_11439 [Halanaerobium saccharolyticum]TDW03070.1 hypothetical protein C8C77_11339 [Halanaerobium saccharolyticum]TDX59366.1 hypothetical protein C7956_11539 [Halanaerobium saccharolyticum]